MLKVTVMNAICTHFTILIEREAGKMILQFRTKRNSNGNCKYLGIDTGAECYATESYSWICKEWPELKYHDYNELIEQLKRNEWKRIERI